MISLSQKQILWVLGTCAVVAVGAWAIANYLPPVPVGQTAETKDQLRPASPPIYSPEISVRPGTSAITPDGAFTIQVAHIAEGTVKLTVSATTGDIYRFNNAEVGRRLVVPAPDATYYVDIVRISGKTVHFTMSKHR